MKLTPNERRYLAKFECGWCGQALNRTSCGAIYEKCTDETMAERRKTCLANKRSRAKKK